MKNFFFDKDIDKIILDDKSQRKILAHNDELMIVHIYFKKDGMAKLHSHIHTQATYVLKGKFELTLENESKILSQGDSVLIPSNLMHGINCLEEGEVLDIFTPERKDFLNE